MILRQGKQRADDAATFACAHVAVQKVKADACPHDDCRELVDIRLALWFSSV